MIWKTKHQKYPNTFLMCSTVSEAPIHFNELPVWHGVTHIYVLHIELSSFVRFYIIVYGKCGRCFVCFSVRNQYDLVIRSFRIHIFGEPKSNFTKPLEENIVSKSDQFRTKKITHMEIYKTLKFYLFISRKKEE